MTAPTRLEGKFDPYSTTNAFMYDALETIPDLQPGLIAVETYAQMRRDSRLAAITSGYTLQLRRASWQSEPGTCRPEVVQLVADDMGIPIAGADTPGAARTRGVSWNDHLRSALLSLTYGHMCFELLAEIVDDRARLVALAERMPWTLSLIHADPKSGALLGVSQQATDSIDSPQIKADRVAFYTHERENTWFGTSLLRPAYAPWFLKRELMRVHSTSARRFGMGVPTVEWAAGSNPTPAQISEAQRLASAARVGDQSGASLPPGASLILRGLSGGVPDVLAYIKWLNQEMASAALMPHLDLGNSESGSRALGQSFLDSWMLALGAIAEEIADVATRQIAARIVAWNFGDDEQVPRIVASGVGTQREVTAESLQALLGSGALSADPGLEAWVRREYRLPERQDMTQPAPSVQGDTLTSANPRPGSSPAGQPATAPATGQGDATTAPSPSTGTAPTGPDADLITNAVQVAATGDWTALDDIAAQIAARDAETGADPATDDTDTDWRIDAALARGADIVAAYAATYSGPDADAAGVQRGYDLWTAEQEITAGGQQMTLDEFRAALAKKPALNLTLDLDNRVVAVAATVGRFAAHLGSPVSVCPYVGDGTDVVALRRVWLAAYLRAKGTTPVKAARVRAAAGHPNSCEHATMGSVCHCDCAGTRHAVITSGGVPSPGKATKKGPSDSGSKTPASKPASKALTGEEAIYAAPHLRNSGATADRNGVSIDEIDGSLNAYKGAGYLGINEDLRKGDLDHPDTKDDIKAIDAGMGPINADVEVFRGIRNPRKVFADAWNDTDVTGLEWRDGAFVSTSANGNASNGFFSGADGVVMKIFAPKGTNAVGISDYAEMELLLDRGLRFRVVADHGVVDGRRRLDVEVVPE